MISTQFHGFAQYCEFDHRMKSGGNTYFATYFTGFNLQTKRNDTCDKVVNGVLIEHHLFKNGIMQEEVLYQWDTQKPIVEFYRVEQDSIIGIFSHYDYEGKISNRKTFFVSSEGRRCYEEAAFQNGILTSVATYRFIGADELREAGYTDDMSARTDQEGYTDLVAQYGMETTYHNNGLVASIEHHQFVVHTGTAYEKSQTGEYVFYDDYGMKRILGQYDQGKPHGVFRYYHANGRVSEIKQFDHARSVGEWRGFDEFGVLKYISTNSEEYWPDLPHEVRYSGQGLILFEKVIDKNGFGFQHTFYDHGQLQEKLEYTAGNQYPTSTWRYYENGLLKQKSFVHPRNDTLSAEYFEDGSIYRLNLYDSKEIQETWEYFSPGKLKKHTYTKQSPSVVYQSFQEFYENGPLKWEMELKDEIRIDKHYWPSGLPQEIKEQKANLLHGAWMVFDSNGVAIKNCQYREGLRTGHCKVLQETIVPSISKSEWNQLRAIAKDQMVCEFYRSTGPDVFTKKYLDEETDLLTKLWAYLKAYQCDWPLGDGAESSSDFNYIFNFPDTLLTNHQTEIDSVLRSLNMVPQGSWNVAMGMATCRYRSRDLYTFHALNKAFRVFIPDVTAYVELMDGCSRSQIHEPIFPAADSFTYSREKVESGSKLTISNSFWTKTFVIYDDGYIELFNGQGDMECWDDTHRKIKKY